MYVYIYIHTHIIDWGGSLAKCRAKCSRGRRIHPTVMGMNWNSWSKFDGPVLIDGNSCLMVQIEWSKFN